jgi:hypothetical protein
VRRDLPRRFVRNEVAALLLLFCVWPSVLSFAAASGCYIVVVVVVVLDSLTTLHAITLHILHTHSLRFSHSTAAPSAGCIILSCPPAHRAPCAVSLLLTHTALLSYSHVFFFVASVRPVTSSATCPPPPRPRGLPVTSSPCLNITTTTTDTTDTTPCDTSPIAVSPACNSLAALRGAEKCC